MSATIQQCLANATVVGYFKQTYVYPQITKYAVDYGGPGILLGTAWPFVAAALAMALWRMITRPTTRAGLLLFCVALNIADCVNLSWGRSVDPFHLQTRVKGHYYMAIIFSQAKIGMLLAATAFRFTAVINDTIWRRRVAIIISFIAVTFSSVLIGIGVQDINARSQVSKLYWALAPINPAIYFVTGVTTFTIHLRRAAASAATDSTGFTRSLYQYAHTNDLLMCLTLIIAIAIIGVTQALDSQKNKYVVPITVMLSTIWTFAENAFEVISLLQEAEEMTRDRAAGGTDHPFKPKNNQHLAQTLTPLALAAKSDTGAV
ncbi:hypothetical protein DFJ77DRAFT_447819 [Powellomyces hirtus]|nr:hypothetical protein DFJ77DRAFT_447819 [Powellomyces hirtus]